MLNFEVEDLDAAKSRLLEYGAFMDGEVQEDADVKLACFRSADGVMLSLSQIKNQAEINQTWQIDQLEFTGDVKDKRSHTKEQEQSMEEIKQMLKNLKI
jgi:hypothetical protein